MQKLMMLFLSFTCTNTKALGKMFAHSQYKSMIMTEMMRNTKSNVSKNNPSTHKTTSNTWLNGRDMEYTKGPGNHFPTSITPTKSSQNGMPPDPTYHRGRNQKK